MIDESSAAAEFLAGRLASYGYAAQGIDWHEDWWAAADALGATCLLIASRLGRIDGVQLYVERSQGRDRIPVIFLAAAADVAQAVAAMKAGAVDFLLHPIDAPQLLRKIDQASEIGKRWQNEDTQFRQLDATVGHLRATDRETLQLILDGETIKAMAMHLHITERAVELRRQRLMRRLGVRCLAELVKVTTTHRVMDELRPRRPLLPA